MNISIAFHVANVGQIVLETIQTVILHLTPPMQYHDASTQNNLQPVLHPDEKLSTLRSSQFRELN